MMLDTIVNGARWRLLIWQIDLRIWWLTRVRKAR